MDKITTRITVIDAEDGYKDIVNVIFKLKNSGTNMSAKQLSSLIERATNEMLDFLDDCSTYDEYIEYYAEFTDMSYSVLTEEELFSALNQIVKKYGYSSKGAVDYISRKFGWEYKLFKFDVVVSIKD